MELLFLSFTTLSSTGLGDVVPIKPFARSLVMIEQVAGHRLRGDGGVAPGRADGPAPAAEGGLTREPAYFSSFRSRRTIVSSSHDGVSSSRRTASITSSSQECVRRIR